eukprot:5717253-Lingulodinium_polyedra.AAC.1
MPLHPNHYYLTTDRVAQVMDPENMPKGQWATPCCGKPWQWEHCNPQGGGARRCFSIHQPDGAWKFGFFGVQEHEVARQLENDLTFFKGVQLAAEMNGCEVTRET